MEELVRDNGDDAPSLNIARQRLSPADSVVRLEEGASVRSRDVGRRECSAPIATRAETNQMAGVRNMRLIGSK